MSDIIFSKQDLDQTILNIEVQKEFFENISCRCAEYSASALILILIAREVMKLLIWIFGFRNNLLFKTHYDQ